MSLHGDQANMKRFVKSIGLAIAVIILLVIACSCMHSNSGVPDPSASLFENAEFTPTVDESMHPTATDNGRPVPVVTTAVQSDEATVAATDKLIDGSEGIGRDNEFVW